MRKKFSYILCMMFVLLGMNQSIYGAAVLEDTVAKELTEAVSNAAEEMAFEGESQLIRDTAKNSVKNMAKELEESLAKVMKDAGVGDAQKAAKEAFLKSVQNSIKELKPGNFKFNAGGAVETESLGLIKSSVENEAVAAADQLKLVGGGGGVVVGGTLTPPAPTPLTKVGLTGATSGSMPALEGAITGSATSKSALLSSAKNAFGEARIPGAPKTIVRAKIDPKVPRGAKQFSDFPEGHQPKVEGAKPGEITKDTLFAPDKEGVLQPVKNDPELVKAGGPKYRVKDQPLYKLKRGSKVYETVKVDGVDHPVEVTERVSDPSGGHWEIKDLFSDTVAGRSWGTLFSKVLGGAEMLITNGMIMGMAMSVPNSLMASFTQERAQQAALATVAAPVDFGGIVMQIPDEAINTSIPTATLNIYMGVPTGTLGGCPAGPDGAQWYKNDQGHPGASNPVVGPDDQNGISKMISTLAKDTFRAVMTTLMTATEQTQSPGASSSIKRYDFDSSYYDQAHFFASYSPETYIPWASSAITTPGFPGLMIDLNTGYIFADDGTTLGNVPAPLLGNTGSSGPISIATFLSEYKNTLEASGQTFNYDQYTSGGQADVASGITGDSPLARQFSTACISDAVNSASPGEGNSGFGDMCINKDGKRTSLLATSLIRLASGTAIDQNGKEMNLLQIAPPAPGSVSPTTGSAAPTQDAKQSTVTNFFVSALDGSAPNKLAYVLQSKFKSDQLAFVKILLKGLGWQQQAALISSNSTASQQTAWVNDVYSALNASDQSAFYAKFNSYRNDAVSQFAYAFSKASSSQQSTWLQSILSGLSTVQLVTFIQQSVTQSAASSVLPIPALADSQDAAKASAAFAQAFSSSSATDGNIARAVSAAQSDSNSASQATDSKVAAAYSAAAAVAAMAAQATYFYNYANSITSSTLTIAQVIAGGLPSNHNGSDLAVQGAGKLFNNVTAAANAASAADASSALATISMAQTNLNSAILGAFQEWVKSIYKQANVDDLYTFATTQASASSIATAFSQAISPVNAPTSSSPSGKSVSPTSSISANQMLEESIAQGALGGVVPIYGFDSTALGGSDTFQSYLNTNFPGVSLSSIISGGSQRVVLTDQSAGSQIANLASGVKSSSSPASLAAGSVPQIQGAHNMNYPAFGVYVYECENTPFASELSKLTNNKPALDYIIFFDEYLNVVPLQVPQPSTNPYMFNMPEYVLNPAIAYWTSLITYIGNGTIASPQPLDEFMGRYTNASGNEDVFFPLYTLKGELADVQGAQAAVQTFFNTLNTPPAAGSGALNTTLLYQQIQTLAAVEVNKYQTGPFFAPYNVKEAPASMYITQTSSYSGGASITIVPYVGMAPYLMPMNTNFISGTTPTDYLIPFVVDSGTGQPTSVQLPNPYVQYFVSLVTDIVYTVSVDATSGQATFTPQSFTASPYNPTSGLNSNVDPNDLAAFSWVNQLQGKGMTIPTALITDLKAQRTIWFNYINSSLTDPTFSAQMQGFPFGQTYTLTLSNPNKNADGSVVAPTDYQNKNYMYTCSPSPSGIANDLYVLSKTGSLNVTNKTVGLIANHTNPQSYIVSIANGFMYDSNGDVVLTSAGKPVSMALNQLLSLIKSNQRGSGPSSATKALIKSIQDQAVAMGSAIKGPYVFGPLSLKLYNSDLQTQNYVYFTVDSSNKPVDYFVVVRSIQSPYSFGGQISSTTQYMVSLVTGQLYTRSGSSKVWPNLGSLLTTVKSSMSINAATLAAITTLNAAFIAQQAAENQQTADLSAQILAAQKSILADLGNIAADVVSKQPLPFPYDTLVLDSDGKYYRVTPDAQGNPLIIFDFNATTATKDSHAADTGTGAMFSATGLFITSMTGQHLTGMRQQLGVQVGTDGSQKLTMPHFGGNMQLNSVDKAINPGSSGSSLLVSTDPNFPVRGIPAVINSGTQKHYFYYHKLLNSYFVYVVDGTNKYYISMDDGSMYNTDGSARILGYQVAFDSNKNPMIIAQDGNGMLNATFADPTTGSFANYISDPSQFSISTQTVPFGSTNVTGKYGINIAAAAPALTNPLYIYQNMPTTPAVGMKYNPQATSYAVYTYDATAKKQVFRSAFTLDTTSTVQGLTYVPVNPSTGQIVTASVVYSLKSAQIIQNSTGVTTNVIFNGMMYKPSSAGSTTFTPVSGSGDSITITNVAATGSCAAYVKITNGSNSYVYSYAYQTLSADVFANYQQNVWKMRASLDPKLNAVLCRYILPNRLQSISVASDAATNAVASNVKNVPSTLVAAVKNTINLVIKDPCNTGPVKFDAISGKYFVSVSSKAYTYFPLAGYVDIENGCFYDSTGAPYGAALVVSDYVSLLNQLNVMVTWNGTSFDIVYRSAANVASQSSKLSAS